MHSLAIAQVETACGEVLALHQFEVGHRDACTPCTLVVAQLLKTHVLGVVGVAELDKPVPLIVGDETFGSTAARVATIEVEEICRGRACEY